MTDLTYGYCEKCRERLTISFQDSGRVDFISGEREVFAIATCKNRRHWWDGHSRHKLKHVMSEDALSMPESWWRNKLEGGA